MFEESDFIQSELYKNSLKISKRNTGVLYYDCSNFFFETEQESGLRQYGFSKEHRPNPIVQMGLFMDGWKRNGSDEVYDLTEIDEDKCYDKIFYKDRWIKSKRGQISYLYDDEWADDCEFALFSHFFISLRSFSVMLAVPHHTAIPTIAITTRKLFTIFFNASLHVTGQPLTH